MDYDIRLAVLSDAEILPKVKLEAWESVYRGIYPDSKFDNFDYQKNVNFFTDIINSDDKDLYVVIVDGNIVGYMEFGYPMRPYGNYEQEIGLFYIIGDYQRKGIGRDLFSLAYEMIKYKGYDKFFISCNKYNINAQEFYSKMGGVIEHIDEDNEDKSIPQVKFSYSIKK